MPAPNRAKKAVSSVPPPEEHNPPGISWSQAYGHGERVFDLAFHPANNQVVASASEDCTVRIWRKGSGTSAYTQARCCTGHEAEVMRAAWSHDGALLATGSADTTVRLWNTAELDGPSYAGQEVATLPGHPEEIYSCDFLPSNSGAADALVAASAESLFVWDLGSMSLVQELSPTALSADAPKGLGRNIFGLALQPRGPLLAAPCSDGVLRLWHRVPQGLGRGRELPLHSGIASAAAFAPSGNLLASASKNGQIVLLDVRKLGEPLGTVDTYQPVLSCRFIRLGGADWLALAGGPGGIRLLNMNHPKHGVVEATLQMPTDGLVALLSVAVSEDGTCLAASGGSIMDMPAFASSSSNSSGGAAEAAAGSITNSTDAMFQSFGAALGEALRSSGNAGAPAQQATAAAVPDAGEGHAEGHDGSGRSASLTHSPIFIATWSNPASFHPEDLIENIDDQHYQ